MHIHNFSDGQAGLFGIITNNPVISVRVKTWVDDNVNGERTYVFQDDSILTVPVHGKNMFFHAKKKILYLQLPNDFVPDERILESFEKTNK